MTADIDKPSWMREPSPLERGGHALIRHADKDDEGEQTGEREGEVACALRQHGGYEDSVSARPYFSIRE